MLGSAGIRAAEQRPSQERVSLAGRLGTAPSFRATRSGRTVARFPMATRDEEHHTTWHTVVAFGERAEGLRGALSKGQALEVIGYWHDREVRIRGGRLKVVRELYAAAVIPR